jgi:uncharacterized membrane protein
MIYLLQSVIIWMKLVSYAHADRDLRNAMRAQKQMYFSVAASGPNDASDTAVASAAGAASGVAASAGGGGVGVVGWGSGGGDLGVGGSSSGGWWPVMD